MTELSRARAEAAANRARLKATAAELRRRLQPAVLADDAIEAARRKGEAIADEAVAAVKKRPIAASAAAAGAVSILGFTVLARFRKAAARRRARSGKEHP